LELEKWKKGDVAKRLRELEMERETTQTDKERRKRDYLQGQKLLKQKFISQSEFDDDKIKKIEAENSYETAKLDQQVYTEYTYPMEEEKFNSGVEQAIGELHRNQGQQQDERCGDPNCYPPIAPTPSSSFSMFPAIVLPSFMSAFIVLL